MQVTKERISSIIKNECRLKGLSREHMKTGCEHAEYLYDRQQSFSTSVYAGICLAEDLARRKFERDKMVTQIGVLQLDSNDNQTNLLNHGQLVF